MQQIHIAVLAGTTREKRLSIHAATLMYDVLQKYPNVSSELVDPKDIVFSGDGNDQEGKNETYTAITKRADAFLIVVPEYNHSFPGSLKRMLDSELDTYKHKAVAFAGVSNGGWGGVRAIESLVNVVRTMGLVATDSDMHFPRIQDIFDDKGNLLDDTYIERAKRCIDELVWMTRVLKQAREATKD